MVIFWITDQHTLALVNKNLVIAAGILQSELLFLKVAVLIH